MNELPSDRSLRLVLVDLYGASYDVLGPLAEGGGMPCVAALLRSAALGRIEPAPGLGESALRRTLATGRGPAEHGVLDEVYLDHRRGTLHFHPPDATLHATLAARLGLSAEPEAIVELADFPPGQCPWNSRPEDLRTALAHVAQNEAALAGLARRIEAFVARGDWRLLAVRFQTLSRLQYHAGHLLGVPRWPGGNPKAVAAVGRVLRALDECLGRLAELAERQGAALVVVSPFEVLPFQGRITLSEILCRRGLLRLAGGAGAIGYRLARLRWKAGRSLAAAQPVRSVLPVDWRRSLAVSLHGQTAALVYLNTPERFGLGPVTTAAARDEAAGEVIAALREARHPTSGEPLFTDAYRVEERFGVDPLSRNWPDVIGTPVAGCQVRHRLDPKRRVLRADRSLTGTHGGSGLILVRAPAVPLGQGHVMELTEVGSLMGSILPRRGERAIDSTAARG